MTNGNDRLDRIERILEQIVKAQEQFVTTQEQFVKTQEQFVKTQDKIQKTQDEMAARQQYHDEAFERHDAEMKSIRETINVISQAIAADGENIRALARIAELHHERLNRLEGEEPA